jgi:hypothetical protein
VDEKSKTTDEPAPATALRRGVWVDEGWGYQVEQIEQARSSTEFAPIEYERTPEILPAKDDAVVAETPAAPESSDTAPAPPAQWTLVGDS